MCATPERERDQWRMPSAECAATANDGTYEIVGLVAGTYRVVAAARGYVAARHARGEVSEVEVGEGQVVRDIDVVLTPGGSELAGTVSDVSGGPIARATVSTEVAAVAAETDEAGRFVLWVGPDMGTVWARADGYVPDYAHVRGREPVEVQLLPEASISGVVVDGVSNEPMQGIAVDATTYRGPNRPAQDAVVTGPDGRFRIGGLRPERYAVVANGPGTYGRSESSVLVGLAQHVDGVVVRMFPTVPVTGRVWLQAATKSACSEGTVWLSPVGTTRGQHGDVRADGTVRIEGLFPGRYVASVTCNGVRSDASYPHVEVGEHGAGGLDWVVVDETGTLRGRVVDHRGKGVEGVSIHAYPVVATTDRDGRYEMRVPPGNHSLIVFTTVGAAPFEPIRVEVPPRRTVERDITLLAAGDIEVTVLDETGSPFEGILTLLPRLDADLVDWGHWALADRGVARSVGGGRQVFERLPSGEYEISVRAGTQDVVLASGRPATAIVTVRAPEVARLKLVVATRSGIISGTVVDHEGRPVHDAYVNAAKEDGERS